MLAGGGLGYPQQALFVEQFANLRAGPAVLCIFFRAIKSMKVSDCYHSFFLLGIRLCPLEVHNIVLTLLRTWILIF